MLTYYLLSDPGMPESKAHTELCASFIQSDQIAHCSMLMIVTSGGGGGGGVPGGGLSGEAPPDHLL